jgi:hypothetical protein
MLKRDQTSRLITSPQRWLIVENLIDQRTRDETGEHKVTRALDIRRDGILFSG